MARRLKSDGFESVPVVIGQPRGLRGPSDMEIDGSVLGRPDGFRYATGQEKPDVRDVGMQMLRGRKPLR